MKCSSPVILLIVMGTVVLTLLGLWAWEEFAVWRLQRHAGPARGRRRTG